MEKYKKILENALNEIKPIIDNDAIFFNLVKGLKIAKYCNDVLYIEASNDKALDFLKNMYYDHLLYVFRKQFDSSDLKMEIGFGKEWLKNVEYVTSDQFLKQKERPKGLNNVQKSMTFESYIFTDESRRVKEKIMQILNNPNYRNRYFPFFIYGNVGIGKTHLVCALANEFYENNNDLNVYYVTGNDLSNRLMDISKSNDLFKEVNKLKKELFINDIIIVDDFQMFADKSLALKIFFDIFNEMKEKNINLFLTSDRNIESINGLTDRFMSRINGGIKIQMPTLESKSKKDFLTQLINYYHYNINLSEDSKEFLCNFYVKDIRSLIGALNTLDFANMSIGLDHVLVPKEIVEILDIKNVVNQLETIVETNITPDLILNAIGMKYGIKIDLIKGKSRTKDVVYARNLIFYVLNKKLNMNHAQISDVFNKDRSTITTSLKKNTPIFDGDKKVQTIIDGIFKELHS